MAISYPLSMPSEPGMAKIVIHKVSGVGGSESPYNGEEEIQVWPYQRWAAEVTLPPLNAANSAAWEAFAGKLNGREGTFLLGDPLRQVARGSAATTPGTPLVDGAHDAQVNEVDLKGLPLSATGYLLAGDYIQFGSGSSARLHQVLDDVTSDGAGKATATIWPSTRAALAGDAAVVVSACKGVFRLADNDQVFSRGTRGILTEHGFRCAEAI